MAWGGGGRKKEREVLFAQAFCTLKAADTIAAAVAVLTLAGASL